MQHPGKRFAIAIIGTSVFSVSSQEDVMETFTLNLGRCWMIRAVGRNPLVRSSDRLEALILIWVFVTALAITPLAGAIGTAVHETHARVYAEQWRDRHPVTAMVIDSPTTTVVEDAIAMSERARAVVRAPVGWRFDGVDHTEILKVDPTVKLGDRVDIWVDGGGHRVAAPTPKSQAGINALLVGTASWLGLMAGATGLSALARAGLARRRDAGWDRELRTLVDNGGDRTDRQT
jgi:hypothetical protein